MTLESKFIEGTNNQYSIRNDGVIIRHHSLFKGKVVNVKDVFFKHKNNLLEKTTIIINGKPLTTSIRSILKKTFGYTYCLLCNEKMFNIHQKHCEECQKKTRNRIRDQWMKDNIKRRKELNIKHHLLNKEAITKSYVASNLKIPINSISEEDYQEYKILLQTKRLLAQKLNCSIETFNK